MRDMMHRLIDSFSPVYLQPMTLPELYQRMCMNLVRIRRPAVHPARSPASTRGAHCASCILMLPRHCTAADVQQQGSCSSRQ